MLRNYSHAIKLYERNGNTKWQDCTKLDMTQLDEYLCNLCPCGAMYIVLLDTEVLLCTKLLVIFFSQIPGLITPCDSFEILIPRVITRPKSERECTSPVLEYLRGERF